MPEVGRVAPQTMIMALLLALNIRDCVSLCPSDETLKAFGPLV